MGDYTISQEASRQLAFMEQAKDDDGSFKFPHMREVRAAMFSVIHNQEMNLHRSICDTNFNFETLYNEAVADILNRPNGTEEPQMANTQLKELYQEMASLEQEVQHKLGNIRKIAEETLGQISFRQQMDQAIHANFFSDMEDKLRGYSVVPDAQEIQESLQLVQFLMRRALRNNDAVPFVSTILDIIGLAERALIELDREGNLTAPTSQTSSLKEGPQS